MLERQSSANHSKARLKCRRLGGLRGEAMSPMKFRKRRILWTVFCGIATVLLLVLWVRSKTIYDEIGYERVVYTASAVSADGDICFIKSKTGLLWGGGWYTFHAPIDNDRIYFAAFSWDYDYLALPYWFVVATPAVVAIAPWIRCSKQFSLRTLLIATTLVAVVLGLVVWTVR
jgi:hypothetical protein